MNTVMELTAVALAALLSENMVLVSCMGIGTHEKSFQEPREAIRTGCCLTVVMILGALGAWLLNYLVLLRYGLTLRPVRRRGRYPGPGQLRQPPEGGGPESLPQVLPGCAHSADYRRPDGDGPGGILWPVSGIAQKTALLGRLP